MPYTYLHQGNKYGLRNRNTGKTVWYNPQKVNSMDDLKKMARIREAFSQGWVPSHARRGTKGVSGYWRR